MIRNKPTKAGILPYLSANHPNINPPTMAPQKNIACAVAPLLSSLHTHPNYKNTNQVSLINSITIHTNIIIYFEMRNGPHSALHQ